MFFSGFLRYFIASIRMTDYTHSRVIVKHSAESSGCIGSAIGSIFAGSAGRARAPCDTAGDHRQQGECRGAGSMGPSPGRVGHPERSRQHGSVTRSENLPDLFDDLGDGGLVETGIDDLDRRLLGH